MRSPILIGCFGLNRAMGMPAFAIASFRYRSRRFRSGRSCVQLDHEYRSVRFQIQNCKINGPLPDAVRSFPVCRCIVGCNPQHIGHPHLWTEMQTRLKLPSDLLEHGRLPWGKQWLSFKTSLRLAAASGKDHKTDAEQREDDCHPKPIDVLNRLQLEKRHGISS